MVKKKRQSDAHDDSASTDSSEEKLQSSFSLGGCCQHAKRSVDIAKIRKLFKAEGIASECIHCVKIPSVVNEKDDEFTDGFEYDNTLWLCLKCGTQLCGRTKKQHALQHFKTPHSDCHALAMNTRSFEVWCYECDNEVDVNSRKNLLDCVEMLKKAAQKPSSSQLTAQPMNDISAPQTLSNIESKILSTWETIRPLVPNENVGQSKVLALPPPTPPPIPGIAKRVSNTSILNFYGDSPPYSPISSIHLNNKNVGEKFMEHLKTNVPPFDPLPRVRGLTNIGNTCFFNAVMQCLAQTPYLMDVLKESSEPGEEFMLSGGTFKFKDEQNMELPMIKGKLTSWGGLTASLAQALEELQSGGGVFTPSKLFDKLCNKCPQFRGGDQHDSHELLRHLLESVRSEDLKRYQRVILQNLGYKDQDVNSVSDEMRQKCKIYGNQAADRILRPDQVFRGFLVSTLTCQDCYNVSSRHEYFLDMSLPVSVEKPQPPQRRKSSPENSSENSFFINPALGAPTKSQIKKDKEKERKSKFVAKHQNKKLVMNLMLDDVIGASGDSQSDNPGATGSASHEEVGSRLSISSSSLDQSDADVEDNILEDKETNVNTRAPSTSSSDPNGNNQIISPGCLEKRDDSPENIDKDSLDEDENDSGIATSPAIPSNPFSTTSTAKTNDNKNTFDHSNSDLTNNSIVAIGVSEKGANLVRQMSLSEKPQIQLNNDNIESEFSHSVDLKKTLSRKRTKRVRTQSHSDWSTTIGARYQCNDGECSVQSCLNNFTAVELMTGNNKVGCENCTKRINGDDPNAKTINTNATKQFLVSSPPAVLILHLKRFQLGSRCMFRKLTRLVSFPMILDIAPFCGSKVKTLPNIDRRQKKLLYSLYGVVEHLGGMYGGHYTAYVKVRPKLSPDDKRWKFIPQGSKTELDQDDEQRKKLEELLAKEKARELRMKATEDSDDCSTSSNSSTSSQSDTDDNTKANENENGAVGGDEEAQNVQVPLGKWYYVSDSRVSEATEDSVLRAQAYLLFYERIY